MAFLTCEANADRSRGASQGDAGDLGAGRTPGRWLGQRAPPLPALLARPFTDTDHARRELSLFYLMDPGGET